jgi:hypothetical protein
MSRFRVFDDEINFRLRREQHMDNETEDNKPNRDMHAGKRDTNHIDRRDVTLLRLSGRTVIDGSQQSS